MAESKLCSLLWRWAAWCETGSTKQQVTSWLRESGRGKVPGGIEYDDGVEYQIETIVSALAREDAQSARVLRKEYATRHKASTQLERAAALKITLRTYQRSLKKARQHVSLALGLEIQS